MLFEGIGQLAFLGAKLGQALLLFPDLLPKGTAFPGLGADFALGGRQLLFKG